MERVILATLMLGALAGVHGQVTYDEATGKFTCALPNAAYCAGDSLSSNIIIRCSSDSVGQPGNCNDNLAGLNPVGVKVFAPCYESTNTTGDAVCSFNNVGYPDDGAAFPICGGKAAGTIAAPSSSAASTSAPSASSVSSSSSETAAGAGAGAGVDGETATGVMSTSSPKTAAFTSSVAETPAPSSSEGTTTLHQTGADTLTSHVATTATGTESSSASASSTPEGAASNEATPISSEFCLEWLLSVAAVIFAIG